MPEGSVVANAGEKFIPTVMDLASQTSGANSNGVTTGGYRAFLAFIDATEDLAGTFDCKFQTKNPRTGDWFDIPNANIAQLSATGKVLIAVGAWVTAVANETVPAIIGSEVRAVTTITGTWTYTIDMLLVS